MKVRSVAFIVVAFAASAARGDGVVLRARETCDQYIIAVFSPPGLNAMAAADLWIVVRNRQTGEVVSDVSVELALASSALCGQPQVLQCTASNGSGYKARINLASAGDWPMRIVVRRGNHAAEATCTLPVAASARRVAVLWPYLAIPPVTIALFAVNQWLRGRNAR
ncbi:MAG: hypothetical protein ACREJC_15280 [Tepidisphaeraceae bacterium]